jgi:2-polyprenyl-3-methyl-5-hydroxy-6-metoxy-1,4-benzoquinol methylase
MAMAEPVDNLYWAPVDPTAPNNCHAFSLELIGRNRRVLELGSAAGHFTKALVDQGCRVVGVEIDPDAAEQTAKLAEKVIVGDLSDPGVVESAIDEERFDVVVAGDVLEHLPDPLRVLQMCRGALRPGGFVVMSLPNIAHADVKLQLLSGQFRYRDTGLLDRTHLHFFTLDSIKEMVREAGLLMVDLRRVVAPVFHTEQAPDPGDVAPEVLAAATADPESATYQFVVRAVIDDGDMVTANLAERVLTVEAERDGERQQRAVVEAELETSREEIAQLHAKLDNAEADARMFEERSEAHRAHVDALMSTRSYRLLAPLRAVRRALR